MTLVEEGGDGIAGGELGNCVTDSEDSSGSVRGGDAREVESYGVLVTSIL